MGHAIKTAVYAYDPEAVVIGGSVAKAFRFFSASMFDSLQHFTFPESMKKLRVLQSMDEDITLLGAAALVGSGNSFLPEV
jgi:glucokinase